MRRRWVALALIAPLSLLTACSGGLRAKFPLEQEVRGKLHRGMTAEEVLATFGEPPGHHWVDVNRGGKVHYIAPVSARTKPEEGYAGFTVYFDRGRVWDWEVIRMKPAYEHRLMLFRGAGWMLTALVLSILGVGGYSAVRLTRAKREELRALQQAYSTSDIPHAGLPPDFGFVNRDTTLQMVAERAGAWSRTRKVQSGSSSVEATLVAFEYELPGRGAVIIMPEPPFTPESRIRAVFYRRPTGEIEF